MTISAGRRLSSLVRGLSNAIHDRHTGKVATEDRVNELAAELKKYDLNADVYRMDIARAYVTADVAERAKINPFAEDEDGNLTPERFNEKTFARGLIRLGRFNIKMSEANSQEWLARQLHQQKAAQDAQHAATRTTEFLHTPPGVLLMENPRMLTCEAMHQLELWPNDVVDDAIDDDDEDSDE